MSVEKNMSVEFIWPIRVYYEDTDTGGVVFYANYLKFFERARTEWLNHLGVDQVQLLSDEIVFAVKRTEVEYIMPARLNDQLEVTCRVVEQGGASLTFLQKIYMKDNNDRLLCEANIKVVCLKLKTFTPCRMPTDVKEKIRSAS